MRAGGRPQDLNSSCALMWPGNDGSCPDASWQLLAAQRARFLAGRQLEESYSMPTEYSAPFGPSADTKNVSTSKQPTCQSYAGGESQSAVPTLCGFVCMAGAELRPTKVKPRSLSFLAVPFLRKYLSRSSNTGSQAGAASAQLAAMREFARPFLFDTTIVSWLLLSEACNEIDISPVFERNLK
jgi:hypothetical protein